MHLPKIIASILGVTLKEPDPLPMDDGRDLDADKFDFVYYNTFSLKDGHLLAQELEKLDLPFEIELDDGIEKTDFQFGSAGQQAKMSLYVQEQDFEILADLVKLHFHE